MQSIFSTSKPLYKQFFEVRSLPFYLLVGTCLVCVLLILASLTLGLVLWGVGLLIMAAWLPLVLSVTTTLYKQNRWLAVLYFLMVVQGAHTIEHLSQMVQIHLLGLSGAKASGIIGILNVEWVHFFWNSWILLMVGALLLYGFRQSKELWMLFIFAIYHEIEHLYLIILYVQTHREGNPGLLARGGLIAGGLPISRPDLHALYAVFEIAMLMVVYLIERKKAMGPRQETIRPALAE